MGLSNFLLPNGLEFKSFSKIGFRFGLFIGLILGIVYAFGGLYIDYSNNDLNMGTMLAFGALIGMPICLAICGFVLGYFVQLIKGR